jgi:hypothetical protein
MASDSIGISLTDFVDFTISVGTPKQTKVAQVKSRGDYHPGKDFWKPLREGIADFHQRNIADKKQLDKIATGLADAKKVGRCVDCLSGYKKFLGRREVRWFDPGYANWSQSGITVRINPEVGLRLDGIPHVLKLYFKADPLSKRRVDVVSLLLYETLRANSPKDSLYGVVDVPRGKLFAVDVPNRSMLPLLMGEAASFRVIWDSLD